jgi:hypothetical protein
MQLNFQQFSCVLWTECIVSLTLRHGTLISTEKFHGRKYTYIKCWKVLAMVGGRKILGLFVHGIESREFNL